MLNDLGPAVRKCRRSRAVIDAYQRRTEGHWKRILDAEEKALADEYMVFKGEGGEACLAEQVQVCLRKRDAPGAAIAAVRCRANVRLAKAKADPENSAEAVAGELVSALRQAEREMISDLAAPGRGR